MVGTAWSESAVIITGLEKEKPYKCNKIKAEYYTKKYICEFFAYKSSFWFKFYSHAVPRNS